MIIWKHIEIISNADSFLFLYSFKYDNHKRAPKNKNRLFLSFPRKYATIWPTWHKTVLSNKPEKKITENWVSASRKMF